MLAELLTIDVTVRVSSGLAASVHNFNTAPTHLSPIVFQSNEGPTLIFAQWGLVPSWSKDASVGSKMINARSETVTEKPSFRSLVKRNRVIIPMTGFYEWDRSDAKNKRPYFVPRIDGKVMWALGLWTTNPLIPLPTFTIMTRESLDDLSFLHNRSPVQLTLQDATSWLCDIEAPLHLMSLTSQPLLAPYEVLKDVDSVRNTGPSLIDALSPLTRQSDNEIRETLF